MSNNPQGDRPAPGLLFDQIAGNKPSLLMRVSPQNTVEEIVQRVLAAGQSRVELLVPNGTTALRSVAGMSQLRDATAAKRVRVTVYTSDPDVTNAATLAAIDLVSVDGTIAAPPSETTPRRSSSEHPVGAASEQEQIASTPRPQPQAPKAPAARQTPPADDQAAPAPPAPPRDADTDALRYMDEMKPTAGARVPRSPSETDEPERPRIQQTPGKAMLVDLPGDAGMPRPANNDAEWQQKSQQLADQTTPIDDLTAKGPNAQRQHARAHPISDDTPRPSLLGALFGFVPRRNRRGAAQAAPDSDTRMARPQRTPEEAAARRRQGRTLILWPLLVLLALAALALIVFGLQGNLRVPDSIASRLPASITNVLPGANATVQIERPLNVAEAETITIDNIPLVSEPVTDTSSFNVQGVVLSAPVRVVREGRATTTAPVPIGFAEGTITLRNRTSQPVTIEPGTTVTAGGQTFVFGDGVTVPGSTTTIEGITFGVAQATLRAQTAGAQSNIPAGTITEIPGYTGNQGPLIVTQDAPFAGGTDQQVLVVSPDDVSPLLGEAVDELYYQGVQALVAQVPPGFAIVDSQTTPEITPTRELLASLPPESYLQVFPPIGSVAQDDGRFTMEVSQTFYALASPTDQPIEQQLQRAARVRVEQQRPDLAGAQIEVVSWSRTDGGLRVEVRATPRSEYREITDAQQAEIVQNIAGRSRADAQAYLEQLRAQGVIGGFQLPDVEMLPAEPRLRIVTPAVASPAAASPAP